MQKRFFIGYRNREVAVIHCECRIFCNLGRNRKIKRLGLTVFEESHSEIEDSTDDSPLCHKIAAVMSFS